MAQETVTVEETTQNTELSVAELIDNVVTKTSETLPVPIIEGEQGQQQRQDQRKKAILFMIRGLLSSKTREAIPVEDEDESRVQAIAPLLIQQIDNRISSCVDQVLHNPEVQKYEKAWRGLKRLTVTAAQDASVRLKILNATKDDLRQDFQLAGGDIRRSRLYKLIYTDQYDQLGGKPYAAMIGTYGFGPSSADIRLLRNISKVGQYAHCMFIDAASPNFFPSGKNFDSLDQLPNLDGIFDDDQFARWNAFRAEDNSRYIGLTIPRFLLRAPYAPEDEENSASIFGYREVIEENEDYLWGPASIAFAERMIESFIQYQWCHMTIGVKSGGVVTDLPWQMSHNPKIPVEVALSNTKSSELSRLGFIPIVHWARTPDAVFYRGNSVHKKPRFADNDQGKTAEYNYSLGIQIPYLVIVNRLAHMMQMIYQRNIGMFMNRTELQASMQDWINQYVSAQDNPSVEVRKRRPLRDAAVTLVEEMGGSPGIYRVHIQVKPHIRFEGMYLTFELVGEIEQR